MNNECESVHGSAQKSGDRHSNALKTAMDGFWMVNEQGFLLEVNEAYCRMIGYSEPELLNMNITDLDACEKESDIIERINKVLAQGAEHFETRHRRKDGSVIDVEIRVHRRQTSESGYFMAFLRDISEYKRSKELLRMFKETVENSSDAIGMSTAEGKHFYQNEAFNILFGEIGDNLPATLYVDENIGREVFKVIMAGGRWAGEVCMYTKDKRVLNILLRAYANKDADGRVIGLVGIHTDITERRRTEDALRESGNYIKAVMDNLPIGIAVNSVDPAITFQYMNDNFPKFYRTTRETLASPDTFWSAVYEDPEYREEISRRVLDDCASGEAARMHWVDVPITRRGEETTYIEARNTPFPDKQLMVSTVWDVTGRKRLEKEREQFYKFFQASADLMCIIGPNGAFIKTNPSCRKMLGYPEEEIISKPLVEFMHPNDRKKTLDEMAKQMEKNSSLAFENRFICRDGSVKWLSWRTIYNKDEEYIYATARDITEKKKADEALRESENRLRFAMEGTNDGLWDVQIKTGRIYLSPRGCEILGYRPDEIDSLVRVWSDLVHPDDLPLTYERLNAHIEGRAPIFEVEQRMSTKSGDWKWVLTRGKVVARDPDGTPLRITGTNTDLTEQKKLEVQLRQAQKMEAVGQLAGGVAHDFNNILTAIYGYCSVLQMKIDKDAPFRSDIDQIYAAAERAANLTRSLLAFSRKQIMDPKRINLNEIVMNVGKFLTRIIGEDIQLKTVCTGKPLRIFADSGQIEQVLMNLAANARDAMPNGGLLTIETDVKEIDDSFIHAHGFGSPGKFVVMSVTDTGKGMDAETSKKIFEPFFTTKDVGKGTGLGLSIVYGVIKQHNGYINVYSEPDEGTTFRIYLPQVYEEDVVNKEEAAPDYPRMGNETVLLAEDDATIRDLAGLILRQFGYDVILAYDGEDAVEKFKSGKDKIAIVVMDMIMPRKSGREAYEEIRKVRTDVKVLFMSGYSPDLLHDRGIYGSSEEALIKPIHPLELVRKVRAVLDLSPRSEERQ
jgi:PAS domain S-box-containing protein